MRGWGAAPWFYPGNLLVIGLITYLFALPSLGYYWDDWEVVFLLNARDAQLLSGYFAFDRPFAWPYQLMYGLFGLNPVAWHVMTLLVRWGGIILFYLALSEIWPRYRSYLKWAGALWFLYPGFLQQSISAAYNRHLTAFLLFALSIYTMVLATRKTRTQGVYAIVSWVTAFIQVFTIEYFVGLELIRPLILWLLVRNSEKDIRRTLRQVFFRSLPYLLIFALYFWWRLWIFPTTIPISNYAGDFKLLQDFETSFLSGVLAVLTRAVLDLLYSTLGVWTSFVGDPDSWTLQGKVTWFAAGTGLLLAAAFSWLHPLPEESKKKDPNPSGSLLWLGLWAFLVSALPIWLTSKQLSAQGRWDDRFTLGPLLGAGILAIWSIATFVRPRLHQVLLAVLFAASITTQVLVVNRYRLDWAVQRAYYWQMAWRIPTLEPGTALISFEQPSASIPGYDASFAFNLLFGGKPEEGLVPYWFFTNDRFLNFELEPGKSISFKDRNLRFVGSTSEAIAIVHQGESRCLQVLDAPYARQPFYAVNQEQLVAVSNVSRIVPAANTVPPLRDVFGEEPPHTWCYFFQKADLARQLHDWEGILRLEEQANELGYEAGFGPELLPFIEAHANEGDWEGALDLSRRADRLVKEMKPLLCATWDRLGDLPSADRVIVKSATDAFVCTGPS